MLIGCSPTRWQHLRCSLSEMIFYQVIAGSIIRIRNIKSEIKIHPTQLCLYHTLYRPNINCRFNLLHLDIKLQLPLPFNLNKLPSQTRIILLPLVLPSVMGPILLLLQILLRLQCRHEPRRKSTLLHLFLDQILLDRSIVFRPCLVPEIEDGLPWLVPDLHAAGHCIPGVV